MKKLLHLILTSSFFLLLLTFYKIYIPVKRSNNEIKLVEINRGMGLKKIARLLRNEKLIKDALAFEILARFRGVGRKIQAGNYKLSPSMNILQILSKLEKGKSEKCCFTVPEGYNIMQIARLLKEKGFISSREKFIKLAMGNWQVSGTTNFSLRHSRAPEHQNTRAPEVKFESRNPTLNSGMNKVAIQSKTNSNSQIPNSNNEQQTTNNKLRILNLQSTIYNLQSKSGNKRLKPELLNSTNPTNSPYSLLSTLYLKNPQLPITNPQLSIPNLEGFLFPETYCISKGASDEEILSLMVSQFNKSVDKKYITRRAKELGLNFYKILILASIIEKEAIVKEERPLISAVFHNRLKAGMPLQSCATVIYALGENFSGNLKKENLNIDSPYNTYRIIGLPSTPICSPGLESIKSALYPAEVDYLYFVSMNNGRHKFSSTLEEHNVAVIQYQRNW